MANNRHSVPEVSIDEALDLYLSIACPNGLPEGADKEKLMSVMREQIAKDRPEWSQQNEPYRKPVDEEEPSRYAEIKASIVEKANREEIPEDPEERYLYNRKKEAKENSNRKKEEGDELLKRAALIKKVILEKTKKRLSPQFSNLPPVENTRPILEENKRPEIELNGTSTIDYEKAINESMQHRANTESYDAFNIDTEKKDVKPDADKWFKDFKSLSMDERVESVKVFNERKREMLQTKEELMWSRQQPRKKDYGFSLDDNGLELDTGLSIDSDKKASKEFNLK